MHNRVNLGKYQYQGLPMGVSIYPYVFQDKISVLLQDMVNIFVYMDYLVVIDQDTIKTHMDILDHVINWLEKSGNQFNTVKFNWGWYSVTYLWFFFTRYDLLNNNPIPNMDDTEGICVNVGQ